MCSTAHNSRCFWALSLWLPDRQVLGGGRTDSQAPWNPDTFLSKSLSLSTSRKSECGDERRSWGKRERKGKNIQDWMYENGDQHEEGQK